jgi:hypothetical protein
MLSILQPNVAYPFVVSPDSKNRSISHLEFRDSVFSIGNELLVIRKRVHTSTKEEWIDQEKLTDRIRFISIHLGGYLFKYAKS